MKVQVNRTYNFNAGPSALPITVLEKAQQELIDFRGTGMSVMELSHRSKPYEEVHNQAIDSLRELLSIPDNYEVLFLQGGASLQFSMIPMNFLQPGKQAAYVMTGSWSEKAFTEAKLFGEVYHSASTKEGKYRSIPKVEELQFKNEDAYLHITSNNTIYGTQWKEYPNTGEVPLIADMSSDILSKPIDVSKFALIYAGAQKNLGPSGVTVVIIRKDLLAQANTNIPTMLKYGTHAKNNSLYNTPPTFGIYMLGEVLNWARELGGLKAISELNDKKANLIYDAIDSSNGFYIGHAEKDSRSLMNITFNLKTEELEKRFLAQAKLEGFVGVNGHRSVGGCRVSTYNAVPFEACKAFSEFMIQFQKENN
ncbi:3-phosphoserine/phosphohydroxythreonine transaminase [Neobacillus sp. NRS-1170]|uniref:3-phosphoserine/phosphohydroxythreonine transaminase n=1 Tax=Neobacillus sp. NRS-1170 TaxID=3233898 RepID=UPI003D2A6D28